VRFTFAFSSIPFLLPRFPVGDGSPQLRFGLPKHHFLPSGFVQCRPPKKRPRATPVQPSSFAPPSATYLFPPPPPRFPPDFSGTSFPDDFFLCFKAPWGRSFFQFSVSPRQFRPRLFLILGFVSWHFFPPCAQRVFSRFLESSPLEA